MKGTHVYGPCRGKSLPNPNDEQLVIDDRAMQSSTDRVEERLCELLGGASIPASALHNRNCHRPPLVPDTSLG